MNKRILIISQYFDPEVFQINNLAEIFLKKKFNVHVIAPQPSYPSKELISDKKVLIKHPKLKIIRFPIYKRGKTLTSKLLNNFLFVILATPISIIYCLKIKPKFIITPQYSPITSIIPAFLTNIINKSRLIIWIFDLWPESLELVLKNKLFDRFLNPFLTFLIKIIYKNSTHLFISSPDFKNSKSINKVQKMSFLPTWEKFENPLQKNLRLDKKNRIKICSVGNIGFAHDIKSLKALLISSIKHPIDFTFAGGGTLYNQLKDFSEKNKISNVKFINYVSKDESIKILLENHFALIPFKSSKVSNTIPYRFVTSIATSTPAISFNDTNVSKIVFRENCGLVFNTKTSNINKLVENILSIRNSQYQKLVSKSAKLYFKNFSPLVINSEIDNLLEK